MLNSNHFSAVLGAITSCSVKEDRSDCVEQQAFVGLRAFDYSLGEFGSGGPATKAGDATDAVNQLAFKVFNSDDTEVYSTTQSSGDSSLDKIRKRERERWQADYLVQPEYAPNLR